MFNIVMRIVSSLLGLLMVGMGSIWMMQGLNVGPAAILQGFMVNDIRWTYYGAILALVGVAQIVWSNTRQRAMNRI
jgi:polyferredoxin